VLERALLALALTWLASTGASAAPSNEARGRLAPDFTLSDQHGRAFSLARERGHPVVLFFGYTNCPDVCPTILANLKRARKALGPAGSGVVVALVTVDPKRDTPAELGRFVAAFDPSFFGLTGSAAQLASVYRAFGVRISSLQSISSVDYLVEHTAFVYYIGRDGRIRGYGTWSDSEAILEESLKAIAG
jgi:protein SCO1/2